MEDDLGAQRSSERLSIRVGGLILSGINFVLALPPGLLALIFADNISWDNGGHVLVVGAAWLAVVWPTLTGLRCLIFPTRVTYFAALLACGWTLMAWGLWFVPGLSRGLIH